MIHVNIPMPVPDMPPDMPVPDMPVPDMPVPDMPVRPTVLWNASIAQSWTNSFEPLSGKSSMSRWTYYRRILTYGSTITTMKDRIADIATWEEDLLKPSNREKSA